MNHTCVICGKQTQIDSPVMTASLSMKVGRTEIMKVSMDTCREHQVQVQVLVKLVLHHARATVAPHSTLIKAGG